MNGRQRTQSALSLCAFLALPAILVVTFPSHAAEDENCPGCATSEPAFPEAAEFLESKGLSPDEYTVLLTWSERAAEGAFVSGYRLQPADGGALFDLYSDETGAILGEDEVAALAVRPKNWNLKPIERSAYVPTQKAAGLAPRVVPVGVAASVPVEGVTVLPALDLHQVLIEDELGLSMPAKGVQRIGVIQDVPEPVVLYGAAASHGAWTRLPAGGLGCTASW